MKYFLLTLLAFFTTIASNANAQNYFNQKEGIWTAKNFEFHDGTKFSELQLGYITLGDSSKPAVLILHGTAGTAKGMLNPSFGGELFGPGQVLDASKYFIILTDAIGTGKSSKPSDGLKAKFPKYNYDDMVRAQYLLVTQGLGIEHLKIVLGNSMGGMQTWLWAIQYPNMMDIAIPMASSPTAMAGRNWMMRKFIVDSIKQDPNWQDGNYSQQPLSAKFATTYYAIATSGGTQALNRMAPNSQKANEIISKRLSEPMRIDTNDLLYQWQSSEDFNPESGLEKIKAHMFIINAADDERNPPELKNVESALAKIKSAHYLLIPASDQTSGHGTTGQAKWWKNQLAEFLVNH